MLISLPKLKTHHWAGATLSLKNLFGTLPGICYGWPKNELHWRGIQNSIVDIALTRTPDLAIVDGIVGMEGDGPLNGTAKPSGVLVMGTDLVAVDATVLPADGLAAGAHADARVRAPRSVGRLAEAEIPQIGEPIAALAQKFEMPPLDRARTAPRAETGRELAALRCLESRHTPCAVAWPRVQRRHSGVCLLRSKTLTASSAGRSRGRPSRPRASA